MGTSLYTIANHQVPFENKSLKEIIDLILPRLNTLVLENARFLYDFAVHWCTDSAGQPTTAVQTASYWRPLREDPRYYDFDTAAFKSIAFEGPYELQLTFTESRLEIVNPPYRYKQWFCLQSADGTEAMDHRNEWRRYMRQVVYAFGGNRVLYLADNAHPMNKYLFMDEPFDLIEQALRNDFGEPATSFKQVCEQLETRYFLDQFADLP
ncbi:hypothetical protein [Hymenobacter lucidus]|uniref:DUF2290 domain-containing protein n=1 Tax=Hymenobacter lucidus TaxID=2880930 RepID=A0ABS8AV42_9BACT|nr:hypothetical protein [Hymenobacter lucidus]MCB2409661.1 hypothetical protein [Hymenobacter lucidus]